MPKKKKKERESLQQRIIARLKSLRDGRAFNATPSLRLDRHGTCHLNTGKMAERSVREVYNYAFLVNQYIESQRGGRVKVKSTKAQRTGQAAFCLAVRGKCAELFATLNGKLHKDNKMFSVVAHVPDECAQVRAFGQGHNQLALTGTGGIGVAPGWMPMTRQANGLVAKLGNQTESSSGQPAGKGVYVSEMLVDGEKPECLLPVPQVTAALGRDPFGGDDESESESSDSEGQSGSSGSEEEASSED